MWSAEGNGTSKTLTRRPATHNRPLIHAHDSTPRGLSADILRTCDGQPVDCPGTFAAINADTARTLAGTRTGHGRGHGRGHPAGHGADIPRPFHDHFADKKSFTGEGVGLACEIMGLNMMRNGRLLRLQ